MSLLKKPDRDPLPYWMANLVLFFCNPRTMMPQTIAVHGNTLIVACQQHQTAAKSHRVCGRVGSVVFVVQITSNAEPAAL